MKDKVVKDIMVTLSEYAVVDEDVTLKEALEMLRGCKSNLPQGHHPHRAVLVENKSGAIVGKLGHHGFLQALDEKYQILESVKEFSRSEVRKSDIFKTMDELGFWEDKLPRIKEKASTTKIKDVMERVEEHIEEESSLSEALHLMIQWEVLSLIVTNGNTITGVIRLSDLFEAITCYILDCED